MNRLLRSLKGLVKALQSGLATPRGLGGTAIGAAVPNGTEGHASHAFQPSQGMWCPVANIRAVVTFGPGSVNAKRGHHHFSPNTKVYCLPPEWDPSMGQLRVLGHHRGSRRLLAIVIDAKYLTNWRAKVVYSPAVIAAFTKRGRHWTEGDAKDFVTWRSSEASPEEHRGA